ncbi:MAG: FG-GAP repeat protein [Phycisphaerales bacterium]|nr:FG-GAP repeat protein [Phycisphaerales bacterium]
MFGWAALCMGDINADGKPDFAVAAPTAFDAGVSPGRVHIFSGADGTLLRTLWGGAGSVFATGLARAVDQDGDTRDELVIRTARLGPGNTTIYEYRMACSLQAFAPGNRFGLPDGQAIDWHTTRTIFDGIEGDVDGNGEVQLTDLTAVVTGISGGTPVGSPGGAGGSGQGVPGNPPSADANGDGAVNGGDITSVLNHIGQAVPLPPPGGTTNHRGCKYSDSCRLGLNGGLGTPPIIVSGNAGDDNAGIGDAGPIGPGGDAGIGGGPRPRNCSDAMTSKPEFEEPLETVECGGKQFRLFWLNNDDDDADGFLDRNEPWDGRGSSWNEEERTQRDAFEILNENDLRTLTGPWINTAEGSDPNWRIETSSHFRIWYTFPGSNDPIRDSTTDGPYPPDSTVFPVIERVIGPSPQRHRLLATSVRINGTPNGMRFFVEAIKPSEQFEDAWIRFIVTFKPPTEGNGTGTPPPRCEIVAHPKDTATGEDITKLTVVGLQVFDLRYWGPKMGANDQDNPPSLANTDLDDPAIVAPKIGAFATVGGAITDGASPCLVRILGPKLGDCDDNKFEVAITRPDEPDASGDRAEVFGSLWAAWTGTVQPGATILPLLPVLPNDPPNQISRRYLTSADAPRAVYVPPEAYLSTDRNQNRPHTLDSGETTRLEFRVFSRGRNTTPGKVGGHAFLLRRPPIVYVHGLRGRSKGVDGADAVGYWHPDVHNEATGTPVPTRLYFANYGSTVPANNLAIKGFDRTFHVVPETIAAALREYRSGTEPQRFYHDGHLRRAHHPSRGFKTIRFAANRADVVGHSMGGVITRAYLTTLENRPDGGGPNWPAVYDRRPAGTPNPNAPNPAWEPMRWDRRSGQLHFVREDNYCTGDIRRFISLGSPFKGSPIADLAAELLRPTQDNLEKLAAVRERRVLPKAADDIVMYELYTIRNGSAVYIEPTAIADLQPSSRANELIDHAYNPAYPRRTAWTPLVAIATHDAGNASIQTILWSYLFFRGSTFANGGQIPELSPTNSDLVVERWSQQNAYGPDDVRNGQMVVELFPFHIHMSPPQALQGFWGECASLPMAQGWLQVPGGAINALGIADLLSRNRASMGQGDIR